MTDRNRHRDEEHATEQPRSERTWRDSPDTADDRGVDRDRRSFSGDREYDELGSEMEDDLVVDDRNEMDMDDGFGGPGDSDR
jgi:hypothetical protein